MILKEDLIKWIDNYDSIKYPTQIYNDLVVEGREETKKFSLMGAWKTGSIRIDEKGSAYKDKEGFSYDYTKRWKDSTPVGYDVWNYVSNNQEELKNKVPLGFPKEKPSIVTELESRKGFGFIWAIFVVHCFYPEVYPLYDQHVYRTYKFMISEGKEISNLAINDWNEYFKYNEFFKDLLTELNIDYWKLDRGLWAYGKHLKQSNVAVGKKEKSIKIVKDNFNKAVTDIEWIYSTTFGGKAKSFWWRVDEKLNIVVKRKFKGFKDITSIVISKADLEKIDNFMEGKEWVDLANNIEKINNGSEKDGLGKYLFQSLGWKVGDAQLASHLGVIFTLSGVWSFNGRKRGIKFKKNNDKWQESVKEYYINQVNDDINDVIF
ncbi:hypothetical protein psyc5s11_19050 [Clostridium gelidum]|uniref:Uncharacterized protein n=1 Tax=Clostridium gelidum TaxID=704125 RepID=A0ABM7T1Q3_9CLOT|nr:hypothetical protein [Clostridium gelidum]BCZ45838.1 hypothetical protein psyc5s11_19050 [Clostridium gelidum]